MAENSNTPEQSQVQVFVDERDLRTTYTNAFRTHHTSEEVALDFGYNFPQPDPHGGNKAQVLFKASDRMIMTYPSLKRLAQSINMLIKHHEQKYGEIETFKKERQ